MSDFKWNKKCIYRTYALKQQQLNNSSVLFSKKYFIVLGQKPLGKHNPLFLQRCSWEQEHTKYMSNDNHRNWLCALYDLTRVYFYFYFILYQFINHALISLQVRACPGTLLIGWDWFCCILWQIPCFWNLILLGLAGHTVGNSLHV